MNKHIVDLLAEANKQISNTIIQLENDNLKEKQQIINVINDVIRQLDETVEKLEEKSRI